MDSSQWGVQEKLRIIDVNRLWNQEDCYKCNDVKKCFYKQRIKLPQLQCILFRVAAGVGGIVSCCMGNCYVFSWVGGVGVASGLKFLITNNRYRWDKSYLYYKWKW